jgi:hypothetical protein
VCQRPVVSVVDCVKHSVKLGTYNVRICLWGEKAIVELGLMAHELEGVNIGLCGLSELRWPCKGECDVYAQPSGLARPWKLVWSGWDAQHAEQGVGLLIVPEWADVLLFFDQHSPRLIFVCFWAKVGQHLPVFSAYSPIDCKDGGVEEEVERQSFYNLLFACLKQVLTSDKLVMLGDFNVELGSNWED